MGMEFMGMGHCDKHCYDPSMDPMCSDPSDPYYYPDDMMCIQDPYYDPVCDPHDPYYDPEYLPVSQCSLSVFSFIF